MSRRRADRSSSAAHEKEGKCPSSSRRRHFLEGLCEAHPGAVGSRQVAGADVAARVVPDEIAGDGGGSGQTGRVQARAQQQQEDGGVMGKGREGEGAAGIDGGDGEGGQTWRNERAMCNLSEMDAIGFVHMCAAAASRVAKQHQQHL
jgi:hypothetical protein